MQRPVNVPVPAAASTSAAISSHQILFTVGQRTHLAHHTFSAPAYWAPFVLYGGE